MKILMTDAKLYLVSNSGASFMRKSGMQDAIESRWTFGIVSVTVSFIVYLSTNGMLQGHLLVCFIHYRQTKYFVKLLFIGLLLRLKTDLIVLLQCHSLV